MAEPHRLSRVWFPRVSSDPRVRAWPSAGTSHLARARPESQCLSVRLGSHLLPNSCLHCELEQTSTHTGCKFLLNQRSHQNRGVCKQRLGLDGGPAGRRMSGSKNWTEQAGAPTGFRTGLPVLRKQMESPCPSPGEVPHRLTTRFHLRHWALFQPH